MGEPVTLKGVEIYKIQTLVDRGLRLTLDLSEDATVEMARLMEYRRLGVVVKVTIEPEG